MTTKKSSAQLLELYNNYVSKGKSITFNWFIDKAHNATITSVEGKEYIDFAGGIGALNVGHTHPKVIAAVEQQIKQYTHTCFQVIPYAPYVELAEKLCGLVPIEGEKKALLFSTGSEATDNAIKVARAHTKRTGCISFVNSFHGRTMMALALTGKVLTYKNDFGHLGLPVYHALFPSKSLGITTEMALKSLERIFGSDIAPHQTAAIMIEVVQGEGGFNIVPEDFLVEIRKICDKHGIVLIIDEVQSGFGRTGKLYALENYPVKADVITTAKSLSGGFVLSGVVGKKEIMDSLVPGAVGGTYAGNPLGCVAALAVIDIMKEEKLLDRSLLLGNKIRSFLESLDLPNVNEIRGLGSMIGIEFGNEENPASDYCKKVQQICNDNGLVILICGRHANVIRFLYPLTIEDELFEKGLAILKNAFFEALK